MTDEHSFCFETKGPKHYFFHLQTKFRRHTYAIWSFLFQNEEKTDVNDNETTKVEKTEAEPLMAPAFPNGRRVSQVDQQCCGGFKKSGICLIM